MYYKTNHGAVLKNGHMKQYCSIRCLAVDYPAIKPKLDKVLAVDVKTEKLIYAHKANYVIGSKVPGTMTKVSKLAFSGKVSAREFQKKMGGAISFLLVT